MPLPLKYTVRNLQERKVAALMTGAGIALVTAVFVATIGLVVGLQRTLATTGNPFHLIVLRQNAKAETNSVVTREQAQILRGLPGVARDAAGEPFATADAIFLLTLPKVGATDSSQAANVILRGVSAQALAMRPAVRVVEGGPFHAGADEVIVGKKIAERVGLVVGHVLKVRGRDWQIVGAFEGGESAYGSEIWCDVERMMPEVKRDAYSSVTLAAARLEDLEPLQKMIEKDPRLQLEAVTETKYYADQSEQANMFMALGLLLATVLAIGACFGAMNTMYAAVAGRVREIATLRALGFTRRSVLTAFMIESALLALPGAAAGCLLGRLLNGVATGTTNFTTFSEVAFGFEIGPRALGAGLAFGLVVGVIGGLLPAWRAARTPVARALREQ